MSGMAAKEKRQEAPEDIIRRILAELPFQALVRASSVCRAWRRLADAILSARRAASWCLLCCPQDKEELRLWHLWMFDPLAERWLKIPSPCFDASTSTTVKLLQSSKGYAGLVGLLELNEEDHERSAVWVGNPATGSWLRLPPQELVAGEYQLILDPGLESYKVVNIGTLRERGRMVTWRAEVYSSITGRWHKGRAIFISQSFKMVMGASTSRNGVLYLLGIVQEGGRSKSPGPCKIEIIAYDVEQDSFRIVNFRSFCPLDLQSGWESFQLVLDERGPGVGQHPRITIVARNWEEAPPLLAEAAVDIPKNAWLLKADTNPRDTGSKVCTVEFDVKGEGWVIGEGVAAGINMLESRVPSRGCKLDSNFLSSNRSPNPFLVHNGGGLQWCILPDISNKQLRKACSWQHSTVASFKPRLDATPRPVSVY